MSGATSRFITFELGNNDNKRLNETFSSAIYIHLVITIIVLILAEIFGLWFLDNKLVIPENRMEAAHWIFYCAAISAIIGII